MPPENTAPPRPRRHWILVAVVALATLFALFYAEEDWRGYHAWTRYKAELEAKGESLDWKDSVPPPVPDDQNFAMTPFLAPLFEFNPEPLQPGQSRFRDTNGLDRIQRFDVFMADLNGYSPRTNNRLTDLPAWAASFHGGTNTHAGARGKKMTRPEAAAEILKALGPYDPVFDELRSARRRPEARFNIAYNSANAATILLPHLAAIKHLVEGFRIRALAELELGKTNDAMTDTETALYLAETVKNEPFLISDLVELASVQIAVSPVWEGLAQNRWNDAQLADFERVLGGIHFITTNTLRGEEAFSIHTIDQWRVGSAPPAIYDDNGESPQSAVRYVPSGWLFLCEVDIARVYQELILPAIDGTAQRVYPERVVKDDDALAAHGLHGGFSPFRPMAKMLYPAVSKAPMKFAYAQTRVNEARVACALERYHIARGKYPESLGAIAPRFIKTIPNDVIGGGPLIYRPAAGGRFILYSVGWNEKDDGGVVAMTSGTTPSEDISKGDWVWRFPEK